MFGRKSGMLACAMVCLIGVAPAMAQPLKIFGSSEREIFVGSEPIRLAYTLIIAQGAAIVREDLQNADLSPFAVVSVSIGERIAIPNDKEHFLVQASIIVRADSQLGMGTFVVPPLTVRYGFDEIIGEGFDIEKNRKEGLATAKEIELEKVPIFVETGLLHEVSQIGDELTGTLTVYSGEGVQVLNATVPDEPSEDIVYLNNVSLQEPLMLLGIDESSYEFDDYRVLTFGYRFQVVDMSNSAFALEYPEVHWQKEDSGEGIQSIQVGSSPIWMRSLLTPDTTFEPPKGISPDPAWEQYAYGFIPRVTTLIMAGGLLLYGFISGVGYLRSWKRRKETRDRDDEADLSLPELVYEQRLWHRWLLHRRARSSLSTRLGAQSDRASTVLLRNSAARYVTACASSKMSRQEACAWTYQRLSELQFRSDVSRWLSVIEQADEQLSSNEFGVIPLAVNPRGSS